MTQERYQHYVEQVQELQLEMVTQGTVIMSISTSATQIRVVVFTVLAPSQTYFLYKDAAEEEGDKVLKRIKTFLRSVTFKAL